eukprot:6190883-Pleurochrysis_carterae.AAC.1
MAVRRLRSPRPAARGSLRHRHPCSATAELARRTHAGLPLSAVPARPSNRINDSSVQHRGLEDAYLNTTYVTSAELRPSTLQGRKHYSTLSRHRE